MMTRLTIIRVAAGSTRYGTYYTRIFRVCNARQVPPRVQHVCTMRITNAAPLVRTSRAVRVACADQGEQIAAANDRDEKNDVVLLVKTYKSSLVVGEGIRSRRMWHDDVNGKV